MIPATLEDFMEKLLSATERGEVEWKEGASSGAFMCSKNNHNLYCSYWFDPDREISLYNFRLIKDNSTASFVVTENENGFTFMRNLHSAIELNAGKFDSIVSDFFSS